MNLSKSVFCHGELGACFFFEKGDKLSQEMHMVLHYQRTQMFKHLHRVHVSRSCNKGVSCQFWIYIKTLKLTGEIPKKHFRLDFRLKN